MRKTLTRSLVSAALVALAVLAGSMAGDAHHAVLRVNLEEMTVSADRVFLGRCTGVEETEEEIAQGILPVTHYTFEVERVLKGSLPRVTTVTQLGHATRGAFAKSGDITMHGEAYRPDNFIHGMSYYSVGDRVVLFLNPNHLKEGVTYPVGLYQGAFAVSTMPSGEQLVRNSINNLELFTAEYTNTTMNAGEAKVVFPDADEPLQLGGAQTKGAELTRKRGALPMEDFLGAVDAIVAAHGGEKGVIEQ